MLKLGMHLVSLYQNNYIGHTCLSVINIIFPKFVCLSLKIIKVILIWFYEHSESKVPCPPGYIHLKARPSSSACTLPAGVSSPPHFKTSKRDGSSLRTSEHTHIHIKYIRLGQQFIKHLISHTKTKKKEQEFYSNLKLSPPCVPLFNIHFFYLFQIWGVNEQSLNMMRGAICDILSEWVLQENSSMCIRLILFAQDCTKISLFNLLLLYFIIYIVDNCLWLHSTSPTYKKHIWKTYKIQKKVTCICSHSFVIWCF